MKCYDDQQHVKTNLERAKVLVIEDDPDHWFLIQRAMQQHIPEVKLTWASSPRQAVSLLEGWQGEEWEMPKLILLDLHVPQVKDGWQLLEQIKSMPLPCNRIPIVMLTSSIERHDVLRGYDMGVSSYLVKPTDFTGWLTYCLELRRYWWERVTLMPTRV